MRKPLIGVTPSEDENNGNLYLRANYASSIAAAGGIPVILPYCLEMQDCVQLARELDGILFSGGVDPQPFLSGEETLEGCGSASAGRDRLELTLYQAMFALRKPMLGICRGIQIMNVAQGGTVWQDIPRYFPGTLPSGERLAHQQPSKGDVVSHSVQLEAGCMLERLLGEGRIRVNSFHHQAVRDHAPGTKVVGRSPDGLIEALEMPDYGFWIGVQWHPEYLAHKEQTASRLFEGLIEAARKNGV